MREILVVDDEPKQRAILKTILAEEGYRVYEASNGKEALKLIKERPPELVLTDLKMPDMDGIQLLKSIKELGITPEPAILLMTAYGTIPSAVEAIKNGAFDYLTKPLDRDTLLVKIRQALDRQDLLKENIRLRNTLYERFSIEGIIGRSEAMKRVIEAVKKVAPTNATVLILGESGTGKELIARAIHYNSLRREGPFTAINCASIPDNLLESELFGYEPGAFTGANTRKKGLFESSHMGTVFLDEIGDMPAALQPKLLRVLQDGEVRRLGGKETIKVDIRVLAATNQDIEELIDKGQFREDLYYRLKVVTIKLPPLRERREDIPLLAEYFLKRYNEEFGKRIKGFDREALQLLVNYHWPGNIRQLESVIERAVIMSDADIIRVQDIEDELVMRKKGILDIDIPDEGIVFEELEKELMKKAMKKANNVVKKAAELLGMSYKTFWYRWEKFGLGKEETAEKDI
jgi:DNA-binding NtrC family response regulator